MLGAEIMGIAELAQSVHMLAITPLTSGLPTAISRLTARAAKKDQRLAFLAGLRLSRIISAVLIPLIWLFSPAVAQLMGDIRVLPSLWFTAPCVLILGYSAALNGYCYGTGRAHIPAFSELIEQVMRLILTLLMICLLGKLTAPWLAAVPVAATMFAEIIGLVYVFGALHQDGRLSTSDARWERRVIRLALPTTVSRLFQTLMRSVTAIVIPLRLQLSGLSSAEATARLGMLNGMVMPILMLPCVFTSALSMVAVPRLAQCEEKPQEFKRLLTLCVTGCIPVAVISAWLIRLLSSFLSNTVYRQAELTTLFRLCAPMTVLMAAEHLSGSILSALGQQKRSMYASCAVSCTTLLLTWLWAAEPASRLHGVIAAQYVGHTLGLALNLLLVFLWKREKQRGHAR